MARCRYAYDFGSQAAAEKSMADLRDRFPDHKPIQGWDAYLCACGGWHIGPRPAVEEQAND